MLFVQKKNNDKKKKKKSNQPTHPNEHGTLNTRIILFGLIKLAIALH